MLQSRDNIAGPNGRRSCLNLDGIWKQTSQQYIGHRDGYWQDHSKKDSSYSKVQGGKKYVCTLRHWKLPETNLFYKLVHVPITKFESTNYIYLLLKGCKFAFILLREHFNLINK